MTLTILFGGALPIHFFHPVICDPATSQSLAEALILLNGGLGLGFSHFSTRFLKLLSLVPVLDIKRFQW